jgi:hypothetical protein
MNLQELEEQYQEDMQQAELEGEQSYDDAENQLIDDLLLKLADAEKQLIEVKYHLKRRCYVSTNAKIDFALKPLKVLKEIVAKNCGGCNHPVSDPIQELAIQMPFTRQEIKDFMVLTGYSIEDLQKVLRKFSLAGLTSLSPLLTITKLGYFNALK